MMPVWTRGGKELVYLDASRHVTSVSVETAGSTFRAGTPATLFNTVYVAPGIPRAYDVSADGQRFLMIKEGTGGTETAAPPSLVVVQNWFEELKRLLPPKSQSAIVRSTSTSAAARRSSCAQTAAANARGARRIESALHRRPAVRILPDRQR